MSSDGQNMEEDGSKTDSSPSVSNENLQKAVYDSDFASSDSDSPDEDDLEELFGTVLFLCLVQWYRLR